MPRQAATSNIPALFAAAFPAAFTAIASFESGRAAPSTALSAVNTTARTALPTLTVVVPGGRISISPAQIVSFFFTSQLADSPPSACLGAGGFRLLLPQTIFFAAAKRHTFCANVRLPRSLPPPATRPPAGRVGGGPRRLLAAGCR